MRVGANDANTQLLLDSVQLYKALGGGWEAFEPAAAAGGFRQPSTRPVMKLHRSVQGTVVNTAPRPRTRRRRGRSPSRSCPRARSKPPPEPLRAVRTAEVRYDKTQETDRYFGSVQARYEVDQAFRVGGKVVSRKVDVGQKVRQGDVIAVLDDTDYKLAVRGGATAARGRGSAGAAGAIRSRAPRRA